MKNMYILIGNIGSGKSTYINNHLKNCISISKDGLRYSIGNGTYIFNPDYEYTIHKAILELNIGFCSIGENVVIDETNMTKKSRKSHITIGKKYKYNIIAVVFPELSKIDSVNRRMTNPHCQDDRKVWNSVWERFHNVYNPPTIEEGFNQIIELKKEVVFS